MKKVKRFQEGGVTINQPAPSLPGLAGYEAPNSPYTAQNPNSSVSPSQDSGVNQTFNIQPTASTGAPETSAFKKGGVVKKMAKGGSVKSSASRRADGCAQRGKTKGRMI